ncbi:MAG: hypothetical protein B5M55_01765 [Desulfococcus sp. 4484_242]|nr:MAG: hypothetical protein B5M55_01765 [Desulfococcus sp. 4484_242]
MSSGQLGGGGITSMWAGIRTQCREFGRQAFFKNDWTCAAKFELYTWYQLNNQGDKSERSTGAGWFFFRSLRAEPSEGSEEETAPSRQSRQKNPSALVY